MADAAALPKEAEPHCNDVGPDKRTGCPEAACFTAGPAGAIFALGALHAWLAADRRPPLAAAGISAGAISAAAMQRAFRELENTARVATTAGRDKLETARWKWFRRYLKAMSHGPLDVIWRAFPNPVDFFADQPPVRDLSCPAVLKESEKKARRHYYRLTKLGVWLGGLPIRVSSVTAFVTHLVRAKEHYAAWPVQWLFVAWQGLKIGAGLLRHISGAPLFITERSFRDGDELSLPWQAGMVLAGIAGGGVAALFLGRPGCAIVAAVLTLAIALAFVRNRHLLRFRPLLGWTTWLTATAQVWSFTAALILFALRFFAGPGSPFGYSLALGVAGVAVGILIVIYLLLRRSIRGTALSGKKQAIGSSLLRSLGIQEGLLHDYELHRKLLEVFGELDDQGNLRDAPIRNEPLRVVIVASPLEGVRKKRNNREDLEFEAVAAAGKENLVDALRAALAVPGIFQPVKADPARWGLNPSEVDWPAGESQDVVHLVDGVVFRQNPLPRLLSWLRQDSQTAVRDQLKYVRMFYTVPVEPRANPPLRESVNIFTAASESLKLAKRRDTRQQARQVQFLSTLTRISGAKVSPSGGPLITVDVTEIAPQDDITFQNGLDPTTDEVLRHAANGCRRTLESLYGPEQAANGPVRSRCSSFLQSIAPWRSHAITWDAPGLPEICSKCEQFLDFRKPVSAEDPDRGVERSFGDLEPTDKVDLHGRGYGALDGSKPALAVLASGGVFRGVTHIGFIGALLAIEAPPPDLVIGASVGALMGAALCAMAGMTHRHEKHDRLKLLANLFLEVDTRVALTRPLKNALKQLGIRGRRVKLSPIQMRRILRRGAAGDAGYAATGAPPELIDAISDLFLLPHESTCNIAAEFVAGHFTSATKMFWEAFQKETLPKLDIENALMGTSLLEDAARALIRPANPTPGWHQNTQPYPASKFFCVTSDLNRCSALLLGRDTLTLTKSYDFVEACLSSSAFPAVFSPRQEADVFPGVGHTDVLFSDGGMFDNLPIFPAVEVMQKAQSDRAAAVGKGNPAFPMADLKARAGNPHLFVTAALDAEPEKYYGDYGNLSRIWKRAQSLKAQVKSQEFENSARMVAWLVQALLTRAKPLDPSEADLVNGVVIAEIMRVVPTNKEHINGTFAFCRSLGLKPARIESAIADGCFRTLLKVAAEQRAGHSASRLPAISVDTAHPGAADCVYYRKDGTRFECPFAACGTIRKVCQKDAKHGEDLKEFNKPAPAPSP